MCSEIGREWHKMARCSLNGLLHGVREQVRNLSPIISARDGSYCCLPRGCGRRSPWTRANRGTTLTYEDTSKVPLCIVCYKYTTIKWLLNISFISKLKIRQYFAGPTSNTQVTPYSAIFWLNLWSLIFLCSAWSTWTSVCPISCKCPLNLHYVCIMWLRAS